jgi:proline iminopeptidase
MMQRHEARGSFDHPEYQAAITLLNHRHVCRLDEWPAPVVRSVGDWNMDVYGTMQGPNEFLYIGNLKDWRRLDRMGGIGCPALIVTGQHDEIGPPCAMRMHHVLPNAEIAVLKNSSHTPFYEEPEAYYPVLEAFLAKHR